MKHKVSDLQGNDLNRAVFACEFSTQEVRMLPCRPRELDEGGGYEPVPERHLVPGHKHQVLPVYMHSDGHPGFAISDYCEDHEAAGEIMDRELIATFYEKGGYPAPCWVAGYDLGIDSGGGSAHSDLTGPDAPTLELTHAQTGPTRLIAAMRAYVASKFGDEIELPEARA